jgi:hypothetical protein
VVVGHRKGELSVAIELAAGKRPALLGLAAQRVLGGGLERAGASADQQTHPERRRSDRTQLAVAELEVAQQNG